MAFGMVDRKTGQAIGAAGREVVYKFFVDTGWEMMPSTYKPNEYVDFVVRKNDDIYNVCVRTDIWIWASGIITVERFMRHIKDKTIEPGFLISCRADLLCYLDAVEGTLRILDWHALKNIVEEKYRPVPCKVRWNKGTYGEKYKVPIWDIDDTEILLDKVTVDVAVMSKYPTMRPLPF